MDPESQKLLEDTFQLAQENNRMLRKIRSVQKWRTFWSGLKIFIIIGIALGSFYFLEPYINKMLDFYGSISGTVQNVNDNNSSFQDLLKKL
ncbi:hypothetical protein KKG24_03710 [Patescibacteria group bacterium]|nr:hypothetical protein [Patescibacteria group bacterium]